ncbi:hypothetical protein BT96DRAFT_630436 [Gymnopus androsaceus JB14]|uniref:Uncharacterized protein n=1 Tax=Gymnopus androsaceus JB14 TaxID=1447944 RepID=A0A6A4HQX2_9AGAR|nr:hypothetical protein BT96DRAFT_630436 [Gymnopus androsaceus JB14]
MFKFKLGNRDGCQMCCVLSRLNHVELMEAQGELIRFHCQVRRFVLRLVYHHIKGIRRSSRVPTPDSHIDICFLFPFPQGCFQKNKSSTNGNYLGTGVVYALQRDITVLSKS